MINRIRLMAVTVPVLSVTAPAFAQSQWLDYSFMVDITSGPLAGEQYGGMTSVATDDLPEEPINGGIQPITIQLALGEIEFTEVQDVQDVDAQSPRANFSNGEFLGVTYIVSRFGNNPTDIPLIRGISIDGFAIDNGEFGYVVGANFHQGMVNYSLLPDSPPVFPDPPPPVLPEPPPVLPEPPPAFPEPIISLPEPPPALPEPPPVLPEPIISLPEPTLPVQSVPEPSMLLGFLGMGGIGWLTRPKTNLH